MGLFTGQADDEISLIQQHQKLNGGEPEKDNGGDKGPSRTEGWAGFFTGLGIISGLSLINPGFFFMGLGVPLALRHAERNRAARKRGNFVCYVCGRERSASEEKWGLCAVCQNE